MTPAALRAAQSGDAENFLAAMTPGGIEAQEKRGQLKQAAMQTLPIDMGSSRANFETLGFVFGKQIDPLFIEATFPKGWAKKPTDHSMWSEIVDDKGRKRGAIFYKAAFYDQRATAHLERRFQVGEDFGNETRTVFVQDACKSVEHKIAGLDVPNWDNRESALRAQEKIDAARKSVRDWLDTHFPGWVSPLAHWDA